MFGKAPMYEVAAVAIPALKGFSLLRNLACGEVS